MKKIFLALLFFPFVLASCNESAKYPNIKTPLELWLLTEKLGYNSKDRYLNNSYFFFEDIANDMLDQKQVNLEGVAQVIVYLKGKDFVRTANRLVERWLQQKKTEEALACLRWSKKELVEVAKEDEQISLLCDITNLAADAGNQELFKSWFDEILVRIKSMKAENWREDIAPQLGTLMGKIGDTQKILQWNKELAWGNNLFESIIPPAVSVITEKQGLPKAMELIEKTQGDIKAYALDMAARKLIQNKQEKEAKELLLQASKIAQECKGRSRYMLVVNLVATSLKMKDKDFAKNILLTTLDDPKLDENEKCICAHCARDFFDSGFKEDALQVARHRLQTSKNTPENSVHLLHLAEIFTYVGDKEQSNNIMNQLYAESEKNTDLRGPLCVEFAKAGNFQRCAELFSKLYDHEKSEVFEKLDEELDEKTIFDLSEKLQYRGMSYHARSIGEEALKALDPLIASNNLSQIHQKIQTFAEDKRYVASEYAARRLAQKGQLRLSFDFIFSKEHSSKDKGHLLNAVMGRIVARERWEIEKASKKSKAEPPAKLFNDTDRAILMDAIFKAVQNTDTIPQDAYTSQNHYLTHPSYFLAEIEGESFSPQGLKIKNAILDRITPY